MPCSDSCFKRWCRKGLPFTITIGFGRFFVNGRSPGPQPAAQNNRLVRSRHGFHVRGDLQVRSIPSTKLICGNQPSWRPDKAVSAHIPELGSPASNCLASCFENSLSFRIVCSTISEIWATEVVFPEPRLNVPWQ